MYNTVDHCWDLITVANLITSFQILRPDTKMWPLVVLFLNVLVIGLDPASMSTDPPPPYPGGPSAPVIEAKNIQPGNDIKYVR